MQHQVKENESFKLMRSLLCSYAPLQYVVLVYATAASHSYNSNWFPILTHLVKEYVWLSMK